MNHTAISKYENSKRIKRLQTFLDVFYAIILFAMIQYLPESENFEWAGKPYGLVSLLIENGGELLRLFIGVGITFIYWLKSQKLLSPLEQSNITHTVFVLIETVFVCLFIYAAVSDPELKGGASSPALQSLFLAIAGFIGILGWCYANKHGLVSNLYSVTDKRKVLKNSLVEPITALSMIPIAFIGIRAWTLGWIIVPLFVLTLLKLIPNKELKSANE